MPESCQESSATLYGARQGISGAGGRIQAAAEAADNGRAARNTHADVAPPYLGGTGVIRRNPRIFTCVRSLKPGKPSLSFSRVSTV